MPNNNPPIDSRSKFESLNSKYESDSISNFYTQSSRNFPLSIYQSDNFNSERGKRVEKQSDWYPSQINIKQAVRKSSISSRKLFNSNRKEKIASRSKSKSVKKSRGTKDDNLKKHGDKESKNSKPNQSSRSKRNQETFNQVQSQILSSYNMRAYMKSLQEQNQSYKSTIQILKSQLQQKDTLLDQFQQELSHLKQTFTNFILTNQEPNQRQKQREQRIKQPLRSQRTHNYRDNEMVETSLQLSCSSSTCEIQSNRIIVEPKNNFLKNKTSESMLKQQDTSLRDSQLTKNQEKIVQNLLPLKQKFNSNNLIETDSTVKMHLVQLNKIKNSLSAVTSVHRLAHFYTRNKKDI